MYDAAYKQLLSNAKTINEKTTNQQKKNNTRKKQNKKETKSKKKRTHLFWRLFLSAFFSECVAKGSRFKFGGLGVETCSRDTASGVRNRLRTAIVAEKLPCLWGKPQKSVFLDVSEDVLMSFCVAGVALCDIRCVSAGMCGESHKNVSLHSTLYTPHSTFHTLHSTLCTPHSPLSTVYTPLFTLHTLHFTLHTLHSTLYTPHFTLYTPHSTSTIDSVSLYMRFLYVICIRVRWFLVFCGICCCFIHVFLVFVCLLFFLALCSSSFRHFRRSWSPGHLREKIEQKKRIKNNKRI